MRKKALRVLWLLTALAALAAPAVAFAQSTTSILD